MTDARRRAGGRTEGRGAQKVSGRPAESPADGARGASAAAAPYGAPGHEAGQEPGADPRRVALITGCSSGLGLAAARHLRARGWRVIATCRAEADARARRDEGFESFALDYADEASVARAPEALRALTGGRLDALVNNGAFALPGAVEDVPRAALREIFETNLFGVHDLTRRAIALMRAAGGGRIVNVSSVLGLVGARHRGAYAATKFALEGLTESLRLEMRGTGVHVTLIQPGPIPSMIRRKSAPRFERWIDWRASARRAEYEAELLPRLRAPEDGPPGFLGASPEAYCRALARALEARRPPARVLVTRASWIAEGLRRAAPTRLRDALLARI
ncbi:short-subunit dehydrogenase [Oceanicella actignis]|nr:short-subunit dehydrogenase [Oceanicella actignis]